MASLKNSYFSKAISQIPRLLGNLDRNFFSPTYGCFHRDYWLDKTSDFPDAVRQFAVHALALVFSYDFPDNIYRNQDKIKDWAIAGLLFWSKIQHKDGSFDEFYPYERGWAGPTAFTTFTSIESFNLLKDLIPSNIQDPVIEAIRKAAYFIAKGETEEDHLANHHAMACLAVWKAYELLKENPLKDAFEKLFQGFLKYFIPEEGWSIEYDGVDPGYLSATISFFGKIYQTNKDPRIFNVLKKSIEFSSYFVYPNGFFGGSIGSRNTLHFYPHGYEIMSKEIPLAGSIADKMLVALNEDKLVPPEIISDRYVAYRVSEFLQSYTDYQKRPKSIPPLPFEMKLFEKYFPKSKIAVKNQNDRYIISNLAKGGVIKIFNKQTGKIELNDCGIIGKLEDGRTITTQWIDPDIKIDFRENKWTVKGCFHEVKSDKLFSPFTLILFRIVLLLTGWNPALSHLLKGKIRKLLILEQKPVPITFTRSMWTDKSRVVIEDEMTINTSLKFKVIDLGDEFFVRYVPQSRYFQSQELDTRKYPLKENLLKELNKNKIISITREIKTIKNG